MSGIRPLYELQTLLDRLRVGSAARPALHRRSAPASCPSATGVFVNASPPEEASFNHPQASPEEEAELESGPSDASKEAATAAPAWAQAKAGACVLGEAAAPTPVEPDVGDLLVHWI